MVHFGYISKHCWQQIYWITLISVLFNDTPVPCERSHVVIGPQLPPLEPTYQTCMKAVGKKHVYYQKVWEEDFWKTLPDQEQMKRLDLGQSRMNWLTMEVWKVGRNWQNSVVSLPLYQRVLLDFWSSPWTCNDIFLTPNMKVMQFHFAFFIIFYSTDWSLLQSATVGSDEFQYPIPSDTHL